MLIFFTFLQGILVQSILAADGNVTFALFLYEEKQRILLRDKIGFSSGYSTTELKMVEEMNVFRIDGKINFYIHTLLNTE